MAEWLRMLRNALEKRLGPSSEVSWPLTSVPLGRKRTLQPSRLSFLLAGVVELRYLLLEGLRHRVLFSAVAVQAHEREETVRLSVFGFAVREAGKSSKPPPIRRAGISVVPLGYQLLTTSAFVGFDENLSRSD
jgi:hypothetical protein